MKATSFGTSETCASRGGCRGNAPLSTQRGIKKKELTASRTGCIIFHTTRDKEMEIKIIVMWGILFLSHFFSFEVDSFINNTKNFY